MLGFWEEFGVRYIWGKLSSLCPLNGWASYSSTSLFPYLNKSQTRWADSEKRGYGIFKFLPIWCLWNFKLKVQRAETKKNKKTCSSCVHLNLTQTQSAVSRASCPAGAVFERAPMRAVAGGAQTAEQLSCTLHLSGFLLFSSQPCEFPENEVTC